MKKNIVAVILLSLGILAFGQSKKVKVGVLNGPSCIPVAYLMENFTFTGGTEVSFEKFADPQALLPKLMKNNADIGFMPVNVAAKVYNSANGQILCAGITGLGNLKIITTDASLKKMTDLQGKNLWVAGQGATPEYLMRYLLKEYNYKDDKTGIRLDFSIPTNQIVPSLISGKINAAVVPEPFATIAQMKSKEVIIPVNLQDEYCYFSGNKDIYPLTVMVVTKNFADENKELLNQFISAYEAAYLWTVKNPAASARLVKKYDLGLEEAVVAKAIPVSNYTFIPATEGKKNIEDLLNIFLENNSSSIGGKLPDENFYLAE